MKAQHTPGPWKMEEWRYPTASPPRVELAIQNDRRRILVLDADESGDNPYIIPWDEAKANARLIAAAPDMLEALAKIAVTPSSFIDIRQVARAAIAKATPCP